MRTRSVSRRSKTPIRKNRQPRKGRVARRARSKKRSRKVGRRSRKRGGATGKFSSPMSDGDKENVTISEINELIDRGFRLSSMENPDILGNPWMWKLSDTRIEFPVADTHATFLGTWHDTKNKDLLKVAAGFEDRLNEMEIAARVLGILPENYAERQPSSYQSIMGIKLR